jgi:bifunctional DNase/RNase
MIEMKVKTIAVDIESKNPVMILTDLDEKRYLPIWIGNFEAAAISDELEGHARQRPMTHDLMKLLCQTFQTKVSRVVINDLQDQTYFARMVLETEGKEIELDARPSDSVAMALRFKAPIFVTEHVMQAASIPDKDKIAAENKKFKEFIENLSAEMFATTPPRAPAHPPAPDEPRKQREE